MEKANNRSLRFGVFLLIGIIFSGMVSVMCLAENINLERFYDVGELYDVPSQEYESEGVNWRYNYDTQMVQAEAEGASHFFQIASSRKDWNYLYLEVEGLSEAGQWNFEFWGEDGTAQYAIEQNIQDGTNILQLSEGEIQGFKLIVSMPCSFSVRRIQLRERLQTFGGKDVALVFCVVFAVFLMAFLLFYFLFSAYESSQNSCKKKGLWLEQIQKFYSRLLDRGEGLSQRLSQVQKSQMRRVLFVVCILDVYCMLAARWANQITVRRRMVLLFALCIIIIAFLSWEKAKHPVNWKNPLVYSWFALWIMCIVSEFVVKNRQNVGIFMLCAMGPLYLAWNSMRRPERLLRDFLTALSWSYWAACFFCIFFSPLIPGVRYVGIYENPNIFGRFLVCENIVFLIWLDENLNRQRMKSFKLWKNVLGLVSLGGFLWLTGSATALVAYMFEWTVFLWKQFTNEKGKIYRRNLAKTWMVFLCCLFLVGIPGRWCLSNVPVLLKSEVLLSGEENELVMDEVSLSMVAEAAETSKTSSRLVRKLISGSWETLFAGRDEVWKVYIRHLNLFGHSRNQECFGRKMHAHNSLLQMMHDYGVFIAVPYLVMLYYSLKYGINIIFRKREIGMNLFFLLAVVSFIIPGLMENVVTPYSYMNWLVYFVAVGGLFSQPGQADA